LNSVEAIIEIVRQGFGIAIVPQLANIDWEKDRELRAIRLPGVTTERCVGLLERTRHSRMAFTAAIKEYFSETKRPKRE
jgi:DNA-binding transcriptional LysR family regulator